MERQKKESEALYSNSTKHISSIEEKTKKSAMGPAKIFHQTFEEKGGMKMKAVSDVPRNARQVQYFRTKFRQPQPEDQLSDLIEKARDDDFIHSIQVVPSLRLVLSDARMVDDIKQFCCAPSDFSILGIDTYNVSESIYLTPTSHTHLNLTDRRTGNHPLIPGPAL